MNDIGGDGISLWDEEDGFFYDVLHLPDGETTPLKVRSLVGLIPLLAVETIEPELLDAAARLQAAPALVPGATGRTWRRWSPAGRSRAWASAACSRWSAATG